MKYDKIITGGLVVTPGGTVQADVAIAGEKIVAIGAELAQDSQAPQIDARDHYVIPGVLDVHVHLELPFCGTTSSEASRL
jgi:dihydropyrimidinase